MPVIKIKGHWGIDYYQNGRRVRRVIGDGQSKPLAVAALHSVKLKIAEGDYLPGKRQDAVKVADILETYWKQYLSFQRGGARSKCYLDRAAVVFGHLAVGGLYREAIEQFQRSESVRMKTRPDGFIEKQITVKRDGKEQVETIKEPVFRPVKVATINRTVAYLKAAINYTEKIGLIRIAENPCKNVSMLPERNVRNVTLTPEQYETLNRRLPPYLRPVVATAYYTAARKSEIVNLKKKDINLFGGLIHITDSKNGEERFIPIDPRLKDDLIEALGQAPESEYLFTFNGKRIGDFKRAWMTAVKGAKLGDFHFHDLRHVCCTRWSSEGHSHTLISAASGHKTYSCFRRYVNYQNKDLQRLVSGHDGHLVDTQKEALVCNAV